MGSALRIRYPKGLNDGSTPGRFFAWDQPSLAAATELDEWYIALWIMLEGDDWECAPNETKLWYNGVGNKSNANRGGAQTLAHCGDPNTINLHKRIRMSHRPCSSCTIVTVSSSDLAPPFPHGVWHLLEFHGQTSAPDKADATYRTWLNGVLISQKTTVQNQATADAWMAGFFEFHWAPVWGGNCGSAGCPKQRDDYMRIGHLYVSGIMLLAFIVMAVLGLDPRINPAIAQSSSP
jgi:hypothetical protein